MGTSKNGLFKKLIPKIPIFRQNMYNIPESYSELYKTEEITDLDEQKTLFYVTQFGGFRLKKIPSYLKEKKDFFSKWFKSKYEHGYFHFKANSNFISQFGNRKIEPLLRKRYSEKDYNDYFFLEEGIQAEEAAEAWNLLWKLNNYYSSLRLDLKMPFSGITPADRIDLSRFNSIPHFQCKPLAGNRFFHSGPGSSYQSISSNLRPFLTINGEKTTEIDIAASTLQFLNLVLEKYTGKAPMSKLALSDGDPYQYFLDKINSVDFKRVHNQIEDINRDSLKNLLYTLVYSPLNSQVRNTNRHLKLTAKNYSYSDLKQEFPKFFQIIDSVKSIALDTNKKEEDEKFPAYLLIFMEESRYAREVLKRGCLDEKFPILPLHDSFITTSNHHPDLERIVCDVSMDFYDYVLAHKKKF